VVIELLADSDCKEFHIREPAGGLKRETVVLAALMPRVAFAVAAVQGTGGDSDDVGEVTGARAGDVTGEGMTICSSARRSRRGSMRSTGGIGWRGAVVNGDG
jgi:hypothetical protein